MDMRQETSRAPEPVASVEARTPAPAPQPAKSGALDSLRRNTPDIVKDNAPRVVSALKIAGSIAMVTSKNWAFKVAGSCFIAGNLVMMAFGHKKTDEERERLQKEEAAAKAARGGKEENRVTRHLYKVFHPQKYPLESGLTIFNLGSIFWTLAGAIGNKTNSSKWYLLGGALSLASDANGAFNKENLDDEQERSQQGKLQSTITYLKNRPMLTSSLLNVGADITTTIGGAIKYFKKGGDFKPMIAGGLILLANAFQAIFVTRNDYNIEKKQGVKLPDTPAAEPAQATSPDAPRATISTTTDHAMLQHPIQLQAAR